MSAVRLKYYKQGKLKFLSHLEIKRALERAIRRAGLILEYSQGFNPRPKIVYGTASAVGLSSIAEYIELELKRDVGPKDVIKQLNAALPAEIRITAAMRLAPGEKNVMAITSASRFEMACIGETAIGISAALERLRNASGYTVTRQKEDRIKHVDVGPMLLDFKAEQLSNGKVRLELTLKDSPAGSIKPAEVIEALVKYFSLNVDIEEVTRTEVLKQQNGQLVPIL